MRFNAEVMRALLNGHVVRIRGDFGYRSIKLDIGGEIVTLKTGGKPPQWIKLSDDYEVLEEIKPPSLQCVGRVTRIGDSLNIRKVIIDDVVSFGMDLQFKKPNYMDKCATILTPEPPPKTKGMGYTQACSVVAGWAGVK